MSKVSSRNPQAPLSGLRSRPVTEWVTLAARLILGGVLLVAGALKVPTLEASVLAVRGYQVLPYEVAMVVGYVLPLAEVMIGVLLIIGLFTRWAAAAGGFLMVVFIIGIAQAWARGLSIDCGCFGTGGQIALAEAQAKYPWEIARDVGLLALGGWAFLRPAAPFSVDRALFAAPAGDDVEDWNADQTREESLP